MLFTLTQLIQILDTGKTFFFSFFCFLFVWFFFSVLKYTDPNFEILKKQNKTKQNKNKNKQKKQTKKQTKKQSYSPTS